MKDRAPKVGKPAAAGRRYGESVVPCLATDERHRQGRLFFRSVNRVWLTEHVAARYIAFRADNRS